MVPSPLVGEGQGEGRPQSTEDEAPPDWKTANGCVVGLIGSRIRTESSAAAPLSLSLPHKGGGNVVASLRPSPRNAPAFGAEMCACLGAFAETTVAWFEPKIHQSTIRPRSPSFLHCRWCCARSA